MAKSLLVSLGHNSSAIYVDSDTGTQIGFETERLDKVKSSSVSPVIVLEQIRKFVQLEDTPIFVTHWFDYFNGVPECKYSILLKEWANTNNCRIYSHSNTFTHHDAHAYSARSFFLHHFSEQHKKYQHNDLWYIVADGFGNFQEVISIYRASNFAQDPELVTRIYGYQNSLGLFYQYATDFVGMKMNQDEYKFLGYESHVQEVFTQGQIDLLMSMAVDTSVMLLERIGDFSNQVEFNNNDNLINLPELMEVKSNWQHLFESLCNKLGIFANTGVHNSPNARIAVGFFAQNVIEMVLIGLVRMFNMENVVVSGGLFYNVKLNNMIARNISGLFSVVPLAGDQGAAIGFFEKQIGKFNWDTLAIGNREINSGTIDIMKGVKNTFFPRNERECVDILEYKLRKNEICNLITSKMEYGPRALGNTSSIFQPNQDNCNFVNAINNRNEVMPMAPMILEDNFHCHFDSEMRSRIVGSDQFMIFTYDFKMPPSPKEQGVAHRYPLFPTWSARPQVVTRKNSLIYRILEQYMRNTFNSLVTNTSYNYHGEPIVYSLHDIAKTHYKQLNNARNTGKEDKINLIIYNDQSDD